MKNQLLQYLYSTPASKLLRPGYALVMTQVLQPDVDATGLGDQ